MHVARTLGATPARGRTTAGRAHSPLHLQSQRQPQYQGSSGISDEDPHARGCRAGASRHPHPHSRQSGPVSDAALNLGVTYLASFALPHDLQDLSGLLRSHHTDRWSTTKPARSRPAGGEAPVVHRAPSKPGSKSAPVPDTADRRFSGLVRGEGASGSASLVPPVPLPSARHPARIWPRSVDVYFRGADLRPFAVAVACHKKGACRACVYHVRATERSDTRHLVFPPQRIAFRG